MNKRKNVIVYTIYNRAINRWHTSTFISAFTSFLLFFVSLSFCVAHRLHILLIIIIFIYQTVWLLVRLNRIVHEVLTRQYIFVWQLYWFILFSRYTRIGRYFNCLLAKLISFKLNNIIIMVIKTTFVH